MWYVWLIAAGIFFIAEIITVGFLIFWLGISALIAMVVSFITNNLFIQTLVFVISSCILIPLTKPLVNKIIAKDDNVKTNAFSIIGKEGIVISKISAKNNGQVKIDGQYWTAVGNGNIDIDVGETVKVLKIDGVKLVVSKVHSSINS